MTGAFDLLVWATILPLVIVLVVSARNDAQDESESLPHDADGGMADRDSRLGNP